jgi:hypothetical protein
MTRIKFTALSNEEEDGDATVAVTAVAFHSTRPWLCAALSNGELQM